MHLARCAVVPLWLLVLALPGQALAHAVLLTTEPAADSVLAKRPARIILHFNEPVEPVRIHVLDSRGKAVVMPGPPQAVDAEVRLPLPSLGDGFYIVSWRVVSADSHPVAGSFRFSVGAPLSEEPGLAASDRDAVREAGWRMAVMLNTGVRYLSLFIACGGALFLLLVHGRADDHVARHAGRWSVSAGLLALASTIAAVPLEGGLVLLAGPSGFIGLETWRAGFGTTLGPSAALCAAGLASLIVALASGRRWSIPLAAIGAVIAVGSLALTGHAATAQPRWLMVPAVVVHGLVAAFWLGSLLPLFHVVHRSPPLEAVATLRRFSRLAVIAVALLVAAGAGIAAVQIRSWDALLETAYGRLFLVKLGVVAALLLLAWQNKRRLTPALANGDPIAGRSLARNIRAECCLIACAVAVTAILGHTPPPRALALADGHARQIRSTSHAASLVASVENRGRRAELVVSPGRAGRNMLTVTLTGAGGDPLTPLEVTLYLAQPELGIEPIERRMQPIMPGCYQIDSSDLALPGRWTVRIEALISDFEKAVLETGIRLRP